MAEPCLDDRETPASPGACAPRGAAHGGAKHGARQALRMTEGYGAQAALLAPRPHQAGAGPFGSARVPAGKGEEAPRAQVEDERCEERSPQAYAALDAARGRAHDALMKLVLAGGAAIGDQRHAQQTAWLDFFTQTGGTPDVALDQNTYTRQLCVLSGVEPAADPLSALGGPVAEVSKDGYGKLVGIGVESAAESLGGTLGKALLSGLGGYLVGKLAGLVWDVVGVMIGMKDDTEDKAADRAVRATGLAANKALLAFEVEARKAHAEWEAKHASLGKAIKAASHPAELEALIEAIEAAHTDLPQAPDSAELGLWLLEQWTLQHAGDEEEPSERTNAESWNAAASSLDQRHRRTPSQGRWRRNEDGEITIPDLFIDQCRLELSLFGLDPDPLISAIQAAPAASSITHHYRSVRNPELWRLNADVAWPGAWHMRVGEGVDEVQVIVTASLDQTTTRHVTSFDYAVTNRHGQHLADWERSTA